MPNVDLFKLMQHFDVGMDLLACVRDYFDDLLGRHSSSSSEPATIHDVLPLFAFGPPINIMIVITALFAEQFAPALYERYVASNKVGGGGGGMPNNVIYCC